jgi:formylglycine-generating enzyme required for sulfatase activity
MSGNLWEWTEDWYHSTFVGAPTDGSAWVSPTGTERVDRGGSFFRAGAHLRSAERGPAPTDIRSAQEGARCVRVQAR